MNTQKENSTLMVLVGLPASGKSTFVDKMLYTGKYTVISTDNILEEIAIEKGISYNQAFNDYYKNAETIMNIRATQAFNNGDNIIWDQTNLGINKRRKILSRASKKYEKIAVVFEIDEQLLQERLNKREALTGKHIPWKVIQDMQKCYVKPTLEEGFSKIIEIRE